MMKKNVVFVVLFFVILGLFAGLTFGLPAREFSDNENRNLAQLPVLTVENLLSGQFQSDLDAFLSDQIPLREMWIETNTNLKKWLGKTEINGVYLGSDGYYFQQFTENSYSSARVDAVFALMGQFAAKQDANVSIMMVPTPGVVYKDKLPANAPMYDADAMWQKLKSAMPDSNFIDLREVFASSEEQLYYRTDHHWTTQGAYVAYQQYCAAMGLTAKPIGEFGLTKVSDSFLGTIYSKTLDPEAKSEEIWAAKTLPEIKVTFDGNQQTDTLYAEEFLGKKDQYAYFFGGNWGKVEIETEVDNGKTLVIFKDSFANSFVPYILGDYEKIVMLDLRYFGGNVSEAVTGATDVLFLYEMTNLLTDTGINKLAR